MLTLTRAFWVDETGFIISSELVLIATVGVLGLTVGLACVRDAMAGELTDVADAIGNLNQSYSYSGFSSASARCCKARTAGSSFTDRDESGTVERVDFQERREIAPAAPCPVPAAPAIRERVIETPQTPAVQPAVPCDECQKSQATPALQPLPNRSVVVAGSVPHAGCDSCGRSIVNRVANQHYIPTHHAPVQRYVAPRHSAVDASGRLQHYSEDRGTTVRIIDQTDGIFWPNVSPSLSLW